MTLVFITHNVLFAVIAHICNNIILFILEKSKTRGFKIKNDRNK
jgi:ABC-type dipeptide/oligopeptide/nickel transport system ATPase component